MLFSKHLVADHPEIKTHLAKFISKNKISMIPYGAEFIQKANADCLKKFKIEKFKYSLIIARPEPENSVFEIIKAFSNKHRNQKLVVLGKYDFKQNLYHKKIKETASKEVYFIGPVYNRDIVSSLRYFSRLYFHGHQVGGTNPSLVESLAAQNTIVCNDNKYNRWVSGDGALYFSDIKSLINILNNIDKVDLDQLRINALDRYNKLFKNEIVLNNYEKLLLHFV